jgi:hypothetical protein
VRPSLDKLRGGATGRGAAPARVVERLRFCARIDARTTVARLDWHADSGGSTGLSDASGRGAAPVRVVERRRSCAWIVVRPAAGWRRRDKIDA